MPLGEGLFLRPQSWTLAKYLTRLSLLFIHSGAMSSRYEARDACQLSFFESLRNDDSATEKPTVMIIYFYCVLPTIVLSFCSLMPYEASHSALTCYFLWTGVITRVFSGSGTVSQGASDAICDTLGWSS